ncbi:4706_t:CDS:2, partial [Entrophospora sp. SA101]
FISEKFDRYGIIEGLLCPVCKLDHEDGKSVKEMTLRALTPEYLDWYAKLVEVPSSLTDKIRLILYRAYTEETGLDPWIMSETPEPPQIEKTDNYLSQDCVIKISKFPEEKSTIHEAVHKRFPFLSYTNSNAWHRDVFKYTDSEAKCPVCKEVHTRRGIWGDWSCLELTRNSNKGTKQNQ